MSRAPHIAAVLMSLFAAAPSEVHALDSCTLPSVASVAFGSYDPLLGGAVDSTGTITYHCTGSPETIAISIDPGDAGAFWPRRMHSGSWQLAYNLYLDPSRASVWGDGSGATSVFQETAVIGTNTSLTVFGRISGGQNPHVGSYSDTLVVTVSF